MVLIALEAGPKHGYEVAKFIKERSDGFFSLSYGALYPVLHKLEKEKLIAGEWAASESARKKKVYTLTKRGRIALGEERAAYEEYAAALAKLLEEGQK